ncbi:unnamed protein product, partial [Mesorhabditis spiculigera]
MSLSDLQREFPIHWAVYGNDLDGLRGVLDANREIDLDKLDCRGRSPLMLAVSLGHTACAKELLLRGADADSQNKGMWSVSHEAVSSCDPDLIRLVIKHRDHQRSLKTSRSMRSTLKKLKDTPDFYAEMNWEFSSWVPFVSRMCPSDTYKIYKSGSSVRIDTTLVGFEGTSWKRGNQTFIFRLTEQDVPQLIIMDHNAQSATCQRITDDDQLEDYDPPEEAITFRMSEPISTTYIDVDKIGFERSKGGGFFSWIASSERTENVDGYDCKVFNASNVDLVTKQRLEHLSTEDKARLKQESDSHPLSSVLKMVRSETAMESPQSADHLGGITVAEYLDKDFDLQCDIGKAKQICRKSNTFKATLWLAEDYPLQLQEQVIPIVDLMASNSAHFARLNNFIRLQLPAGFPAKIEIPLFHVVSAKITFGNINKPGPYVTPLGEDIGGVVSPVTIEDVVFEVPAGYRSYDENAAAGWWDREPDQRTAPHPPAQRHLYSAEQQEEMLLQLAIQQSLSDSGQGSGLPDSGGAVAFPIDKIPFAYNGEDAQLAMAIQESLRLNNGNAGEADQQQQQVVAPFQMLANNALEDDLARALRISQAEDEQRRQQLDSDDEELARILEMSKTIK